MAKIIQAQEGRTSQQSRLGIGSPLSGIQRLAEAEKAIGQEITAVGDQYFKAAERSIDESFYNDAMADATLQLNTLYNERLKNPTNKDGTPNFDTLERDVQDIGKNIKESLGFKLIRGNVRSKFNSSFDSMMINKRLQAQGEARKQHLEYATASLNKSLKAYKESAKTDDPSNVNQYIGQIEDTIENAVEAGVLDRVSADKLIDSSNREVRLSLTQSLIDQDPTAALEYLSGNSGLDSEDVRNMARIAHKAVEEQDKRIDSQAREVESRIKHQQKQTALALEEKLIRGQLTEKELELAAVSPIDLSEIPEEIRARVQADEDTAITAAEKVKLLRGLVGKQKKDTKKQETFSKIYEDISSGEILRGHKQSDIDGFIEKAAQQLAGTDEQGNPKNPTLNQYTDISLTVKAPSKTIKDILVKNLKYGSPDNLEETLESYSRLSELNPIALDGMSEKDESVLTFAKELVTRGGLTASEAIEKSRDLAYNAKEPERKAREQAFKKEELFSADNIDQTIEDMLDIDTYTEIGEATLEPGLKEFITKNLREAYVNGVGDPEAAVKAVSRRIKSLHGVSEINANRGYISDSPQYMMLPPEQVYSGFVAKNGMSPIIDNLQSLSAEHLPEGVDKANVEIHADSLSRIPGSEIDYGVYYVEEKGNPPIPLINKKTGNQLRWRFDPKEATLKNQEPMGELSSADNHFSLAESFLGKSEHKDAAVLSKFFESSMGQKVDPVKTPWCAAFVNSVLGASGEKGTNSLAARSFLKWGRATNNPKEGDIVVLSRGNNPAFGHVGFFAGHDSQGNIKILGGNQGNTVSIKTYPKSRLLSYRTAPTSNEIQEKL